MKNRKNKSYIEGYSRVAINQIVVHNSSAIIICILSMVNYFIVYIILHVYQVIEFCGIFLKFASIFDFVFIASGFAQQQHFRSRKRSRLKMKVSVHRESQKNVVHIQNNEDVQNVATNSHTGAHMSCRFPYIDPLETDVLRYLKHPKSFKCKKIQEYFSFIDHNANEVRLNATLFERNVSRVTCYWKYLSKKVGHKNGIDESLPKLFATTDPVPFPESGMIQVECYQKRKKKKNQLKRVYFNVHAKSQPIKTPLHAPDSQQLSVYIVIFESMSTARFSRHMTSLTEFMAKNSAFTFEGYSKVADNTFVNIVPVLTGLRANKGQRGMGDEFHAKNKNIQSYDEVDSFIWKDFARKGYVTAFVENESKIGAFSYGKKVGFKQAKPFDYFFRPYFFRQLKMKKKSSNFCFGNDEVFASQLNLTQELFEEYGNRQRLFAINIITKPGHDEENDVERIDDTLAQSLNRLHQKDAFNKTIIIMMGDHGPRFGKVRLTKNGYFEERLTFFSMILPKWFRKKYSQIVRNLRKNRNRLTTPFDVHQTLKTILNGNYDKLQQTTSSVYKHQLRGIELFREIPNNRTCRSAGIPQFYCPCFETKENKVDSKLSKKLARDLVTNINGMLRKRKYDSKCVELQLKEVLQVTSMKDDSLSKENTSSSSSWPGLYKIVVETKPGGGIFEGFLLYNKKLKQTKFEETVSRLNLYGRHGKCIDSGFEKYCYCKDQKT